MEKDPEFLREEWALYGVGTVVILLRFATRIKTVGFRGFQGDDAFSLLVLAFFTLSVASVHITYHHGTNVDGDALQKMRGTVLSDDEIRSFEIGSKSQLVTWYAYTALIWCLKGTVLCFFNRLTIGIWQHRFVKWLGVACIVSYIAVILTLTLGCIPFRKNWQVVPDPGETCTIAVQNFIVTVILNVLTDAAILIIPLPLLWKLKVPTGEKVIIAVLISPGLFMIAAAITRVVLSLIEPGSLNTDRWGVRESVVGIVAANVPILRPLWSKAFWSKSSFQSASFTHGTTENMKLPDRCFEFGSPPNTGKRRNTCWEEEADIGVDQLEFKSDLSLRPRLSGESSEFIMPGHERVMEGVTVQTSYDVSYQISTAEAHGTPEAAWDHGGSSKVTVQAARSISREL